MIRETLRKAAAGEPLSAGEAERALEEIMEGTVDPAVTAALLTALRVRGESVGEIVGFARAMRRFAERVEAPAEPRPPDGRSRGGRRRRSADGPQPGWSGALTG